MSRIAFLALVVLIGCQSGDRTQGPAYRDTAQPIYSSAVFDPARFQGTYRVVSGMRPETHRCASGGTLVKDGGSASYQMCLAGRMVTGKGRVTLAGPGRLKLPGLDEALWVLWADADYRTLVLGSVSGRYVAVLNKGGDLPRDREKAAQEILDWNGFDLGRYRRY